MIRLFTMNRKQWRARILRHDANPVKPFAGQVRTELALWESRRFGEGDDSGLPPLPYGWVTCTDGIDQPLGTDRFQVQLVQHPSGGWVMVFGLKPYTDKTVLAAHTTFEDLYAEVSLHATTSPPAYYPGPGFWLSAEQILRDFISAHYDPTDPDEAAEQIVVALGGTAHRLPAALLSQS